MTVSWLFNLRTLFTKKPRRSTSKGLSFKEARSVGIFIKNNDPGANPFIQKFIKDLEGLEKKLEIVCFFDKIVNSKYEFSFHVHTKKNVNVWGVPKDSFLKEFQRKRYDFLIFLVDDWNLEILPFLKFSKARLIVGDPDKIPMDYLDLGIKVDNGNLAGMPELALNSLKKIK